MSLIVEPLQRDKHNRLPFSSGVDSLDSFLHQNAHQAIKKRLSQTYVAVDDANESEILGFYTVTPCRIDAGQLPLETIRASRLPQSKDLPANLVAQLAVCESVQGRGIGALLMMDALNRCARVSADVGGVAVVVDTIDDSVVEFYAQYGFERFDPDSRRMFIMMATVQALVGGPEEKQEAG